MIEGSPPPLIERFFWVQNFRFQDFWGWENFGKYFLWYSKLMFLFFMLYHYILILSGNFYGSKIQHWIFGGYILVQGFFGGLFEAQGIVLGFWFLPPFDHPCHLKSEVLPLEENMTKSCKMMNRKKVHVGESIEKTNTPVLSTIIFSTLIDWTVIYFSVIILIDHIA